MTRIWFLSDIHNDPERPWQPPEAPDCDVIVVAGDASEKLRDRALPLVGKWFGRLGKPILYVPGNHDFYGRNIDDEVAKSREVAESLGIRLLANGDTVTLGGTLFVGATLWTDFALHGDVAASGALAWKGMNDYRYIRSGTNYRKFDPKGSIEAHRRQLAALDAALTSRDPAQPCVVVTHHAPHPASLMATSSPELDPAYASDLTAFIERTKPDLWLHGHIHANRDYLVGATRILSNPRGRVYRTKQFGYLDENPEFDSTLVVSVEKPEPDPSALPSP